MKFGEVKNALIEIKDWLNKHPTEIVVPYFGNMKGLDKRIWRFSCEYWESVASSVIQATVMVEFEDGLTMGVLPGECWGP